jgi:hypothetical protein
MKLLPLLCGTALCATLAPQAFAAPLLRCFVTYAGTTHTVEAHVVSDPYPVPSVDIGGRFYFKPVMVGQGQQVEYIKLYTYLDTRRQPVLVQQATYRAPFPKSASPALLTGEQTVIAGPVERELQYHCTLQEVQP